MTALDPRIGTLNSGLFYAFVNGYDQPEFSGSLQEVEVALGLREAAKPVAVVSSSRETYDVLLTFQYPAWNEAGGVPYEDIVARSKSEAISIVRKLAADDGHTGRHRGRYYFKATQRD